MNVYLRSHNAHDTEQLRFSASAIFFLVIPPMLRENCRCNKIFTYIIISDTYLLYTYFHVYNNYLSLITTTLPLRTKVQHNLITN